MADWPSIAEVKRRVGITVSSAETDADVQSALDAAIEMVTRDCTELDAVTDEADGLTFSDADGEVPPQLREAALLLCASVYKAPDAPYGVAGVFETAAIYVAREHPTYARLLTRYRANFGIA